MTHLTDFLTHQGWLKTPRIIQAFRKIKREDFLPEDIKHLAEYNGALPIGYGQTISQPSVVAFMLELLQPEPGEKILDIGSGSGWTTALLAFIVSRETKKEGPRGKVFAVEIIPELLKFGKGNVSKYNFVEKGTVEFIQADGSKGLSAEAPFDKILASASAKEIPPAWKKQIKTGGRIVAPVKNSIILLEKKGEDEFEEREYPGFVFVPLVEKQDNDYNND